MLSRAEDNTPRGTEPAGRAGGATVRPEVEVVDVGGLHLHVIGAAAAVHEVDVLESFRDDLPQLPLPRARAAGVDEAPRVLGWQMTARRRTGLSSVVRMGAVYSNRARAG
ncbi:hypothetical protein [Streptomyces sp. enrichment culture]|uniref:hypothetical protein n=1 Tax=Streptomyces sp. enrichment culture TaxID=1795815 RepID=UPI003F55D74E